MLECLQGLLGIDPLPSVSSYLHVINKTKLLSYIIDINKTKKGHAHACMHAWMELPGFVAMVSCGVVEPCSLLLWLSF